MIKNIRQKHEEIVISGVGVVSPIGIGRQEFWEGLDKGRVGTKPISLFDTSGTRAKLGAEVTDFRPGDIIGHHGLRNYDRCINLSLSAAKLALEDAALTVTSDKENEFGIVLGSSLGSIKTISEIDKQALREGPRSLDPGQCANVVLCSPASQSSIRFGIKGFSTTISAGFNSTYCAFKYSLCLLRDKRVKYILVGSVEELCEQTFKGFYRLGLLSGSQNGHTEINAPFDRRRNGFVLGEGAAMFVLERKDTALARATKLYARIGGCWEQFVHRNSHKSLPYSLRHIGNIANELSSKLRNDLDKIDFVSLGANSSVLGDALESNLMRLMFAKRTYYPGAGAVKSFTGESYSAGGCFQLLGALYALDRQRVFPTLGFAYEDERCPAPFLERKNVNMSIRKALIWNIGYGRTNYYMILEKV
ncbi:hypothetical protein HY626_04150 [Candidatus Uhrbacteria bacterium]|nr:hypothetical protein [Candidatus Uhrbacteria bacterium]